jgi:UDP-N-acetylglucosamine transferase subunit ALG13
MADGELRDVPPPPRRDLLLPTVLFTIGTDHHRFDRIIGWAERWASDNRECARAVVQYGSSRPPVDVECYERLPREELGALMQSAKVVVTHGGGGSITQCWRTGKIPVVVPRLGRLGEHVDEHQTAFASRLASMGYATIASTYEDMDELIRERITDEAPPPAVIDVTRPSETVETIGRMIDELVASRQRVRTFLHR